MSDKRVLSFELARHCLLRDQLLARLPEIDDETLSDTLEGLTDLREVLSEFIRSALIDEAMLKGLKGRLTEMRERQDRLQTRARLKRALALSAMEICKIEKIAESDFTASLRQGSPVVAVTAEDEVPHQYWRLPPPVLDRQEILAQLKTGAEIAGVTLVQGATQLTVRTK